MTGWDDLPDEVQEIVSAFVHRNLEAELAEEAIRLQSFVKEIASELLKFRKGGLLGAGASAQRFQRMQRFPDAELPRVEAEFRASELGRACKLKESLFFGGVPEREIRLELCRAVTVYVDRCTAAGVKPEFTRPYLQLDRKFYNN